MSADDHPNPDAGGDNSDPDDGLAVETVGIEEVVRQERVRSIFESRRTCREKRLEAKEEGRPVLYRDAVEGYLREVEALFQQTEEGQKYWNNYNFGGFELTPIPSDVEGYNKIEGVLDEKRVDFIGLRSLFAVGDPIRERVEVRVPSKRMGPGSTIETVILARPVPFTILDSMFSVTNTYLSNIGFGVEVDQAQKNTKLDDDLMKEVEQWRRENL
jgi:hypothetical protein